MAKLVRLLHISDLHFGDTLFTPWWAISTWIPGLEVHSERVVRELSNLVRLQPLHSLVPMHVIATGDLTTWGRPSAFSLVYTYLRGVAFILSGLSCGHTDGLAQRT